MTIADSKNLARGARFLVVEARRGSGSPPVFEQNWQPIWDAKVDRITINKDKKPSIATIWFPNLRWQESKGLSWGDMVRIRTDEPQPAKRTIVFCGFITGYQSGFTGGNEQKGSSYERNAIVCQDHRWLLATTSPILGQIVRGPDDYWAYGLPDQSPKADSYIWATGKRAIFNADGRPNRAVTLLQLSTCDVPIFDDPDFAVPWSARDMLRYVLSPLYNMAYRYLPIPDPNQLTGLNHTDFDKVLTHIVVDTLNVIEAVALICSHLGWGFREDYANDGTINLVFSKVAGATGYVRNEKTPVILHRLHAPAVGETIDTAVSQGKKMIWSMDLAEDISAVINNPFGMGAPDRFEFTAELVPAWLDSYLVPDTTETNANLFFTESELQLLTDPNSKSYYKFYHPRGSIFQREVGRKWSLNESGKYSIAGTYDRGMPYDFSTVIPPEYILNGDGKRLFAPFNRRLLPSLTVDYDILNTVGIRVEFSFDGGSSWQIIPASIASLTDECGIYIEEANLAELADQAGGTISGGDLDGIALNFWTSLADDKLNSRSFKNGDWQTRIRITASVQLDLRLLRKSSIDVRASGSPFLHSAVYDFSEKYGLAERTESSYFSQTDLPAIERGTADWLSKHLGGIRRANQDMSISGQFTLERFWLGDGRGQPDFAIGDCIEAITGRAYSLSASLGPGVVYPEIVQIIYLPDRQKMKLITRDLRFAEVLL